MPYTQEQLQLYNTKPIDAVQYSTMQFSNPIIGVKRLVAAGPNGPFTNKSFMVNGVLEEFQCVAAEVPDVTSQATTDLSLGTIKLGRVASQMRAYLNEIGRFALIPEDKVIECKLAIYSTTQSEPIYERVVYVGENGISINENDVNITLEFDNPSKARFTPFYDTEVYTGLRFA